MKAKIYYILILGLLFWHPRHTFASDVNKTTLSLNSFQKTQAQNLTVSYDSKSQNTYFDEVIDFDDDDDVSFSARKKIYFERAFHFNNTQNIHCFYNELHNNYSSPVDFYHLTSSHFISLRVLRL